MPNDVRGRDGIYQAAKAYELFTGDRADPSAMRTHFDVQELALEPARIDAAADATWVL